MWNAELLQSMLWKVCNYTHTHTRLTALFPGLPRWAGTRKVQPIWILLKQETVSGSGISWAICNSAPRSRQITTPAPHDSIFYRPDALPAAQPTASKHWRDKVCNYCKENPQYKYIEATAAKQIWNQEQMVTNTILSNATKFNRNWPLQSCQWWRRYSDTLVPLPFLCGPFSAYLERRKLANSINKTSC